MNREDIIRMAREAEILEWCEGETDAFIEELITCLERFFHMAQAAERDEILKLCEPPENSHQYVHTFKKIIRARGQA